MNIHFPTNYSSVVDRIKLIDTKAYTNTRNFLNGAVTYLSPYITRGVISLPTIKEIVLQKFTRYESDKLLQELAWREYYQRVWQQKGDAIFTDLKQEQVGVTHHQIPEALVIANTGITAIDNAIENLYQMGYMHNHARMHTAMLTCNMAKSHWGKPAQWMYYHLLDGDLASNALSWQWVAGSFSSKKYYANQENINKYTGIHQPISYLNHPYETIAEQAIPDALLKTTAVEFTTTLPAASTILFDNNLPILIYNSYQLDPLWQSNMPANRILLLEPSHFKKHPISSKVLNFIIQLAQENIPTIQIAVGEFSDIIPANFPQKILFKEHPIARHYNGIKESRDWLFPEVTGYYPSFFGYYKKCEKYR